MLGELDGIVEEVDQDLAQTGHIAGDSLGRARFDQVGQVQPFLRGFGGQQFQGALHALAQVKRLAFQLHLAGLDFGKVQDVVDDGQQGIGAVADSLGEFSLLRSQAGVQQQAGHADHAVHRRANLVAHVSQKGALSLIGRIRSHAGLLGLAGGLGQLSGAFGHFGLQRLPVILQ